MMRARACVCLYHCVYIHTINYTKTKELCIKNKKIKKRMEVLRKIKIDIMLL